VLSDHLVTPRQIIDGSKQVRWQWDNLDPFGANAPNTNPAGVGVLGYNLRFPGQYADGESGLFYNYYRTYDPKAGRYTQSDPIGLGGGMNTYGYVGGNPLGLIDPLGLWITGHGGNDWWYKLYGPDGNGGYSYSCIPVKNPLTGKVGCRNGFNLHTGLASDGCITVPSDIDNNDPNYPQSNDYDKIKDLLEKTKPFTYNNSNFKGKINVR
jgi:RHS repeat-associated protein